MTGAPLRMHDPIIIPTDEGLFCPAGDFHIDPWRPVATAVITHAHADHARAGSEHYLAQHHSLPIMRHRLGEHRFTGLDYGEQRRFGAITLSLHPVVSLSAGADRLRAPVFWRRDGVTVLPSFGALTGGWEIQLQVGEGATLVVEGELYPMGAGR